MESMGNEEEEEEKDMLALWRSGCATYSTCLLCSQSDIVSNSGRPFPLQALGCSLYYISSSDIIE